MDARISLKTFLVALIAMVLGLSWAPPAPAAPPADDVGEFRLPAGSRPEAITTGPDGNLWFTVMGPAQAIGRITPAGAITTYPLPYSDFGSQMWGIAAGPDGNVWFTHTFGGNGIGRITPAGVITQFPVTNDAPVGIAAGPDGNMWFTANSAIGKISMTGAITNYPLPVPGYYHFSGQGIAAGPDGNMWFTEAYPSAIGRITLDGVITEFPLQGYGGPNSITAGPDGNLWFTKGWNTVGRITPNGVITEYPLPSGLGASHITAGRDGNLWFTGSRTKIGRITPNGVVTQYAVPTFASPTGITTGPDGNLWFTETTVGKIGWISPNATPIRPRKPCPIDVTATTPPPATPDGRILIDRITTKKSTCFVPEPVVLCRPLGSAAAGEQTFCTTRVTKRGQVRVQTGGYQAVRVTVIARAKPKLPWATLWKSTYWRKTWLLK